MRAVDRIFVWVQEVSTSCIEFRQVLIYPAHEVGSVIMSFEDRSQKYLESGYALGRDFASSLRLNFQHELLRKLLGYSIHPDIRLQSDLSTELKIADVGAGTGQWLLDVAKELPFAQLHGFDISSEQYPSKAWLPAQILLEELDITKPIPSRLEGQYDIVHVQLFLCVIQRDGPAAVLRELCKMLKPGGYIQWVEYDPTTFEVVSPDPSLTRNANDQHVEIIRGPQGIATKWPANLPSYFSDAGLTDVSSTAYPLLPELYAPFMQCHLCAAEEVSYTIMKNDGPKAQGPALRELLSEVYKECQKGVTMTEKPIVVHGRKAF